MRNRKYDDERIIEIMLVVLYITSRFSANALFGESRFGSMFKIAMILAFIFCIVVIIINHPDRFPLRGVAVVVVVYALYYATLVLHPAYRSKIEPEFKGPIISLFEGVLAYFFFLLFKDATVIKRGLIISAYIIIICGIVEAIPAIKRGYWIVEYAGRNVKSEYNMSFGYMLVVPAIVLFVYGVKDKNIVHLLAAFICNIAIIVMGSRGALASVLCLFMIGALGHIKNQRVLVRLILFAFIVMFCLFILVSRDNLMHTIGEFIRSRGLTSRTLNAIAEGNYRDISNRSVLYNRSIRAIRNNIWGYGILADRYYLGIYCHNIFLEIFWNFGIVLGTIMIIFVMNDVLKAMYMADNSYKEILIILICAGLVRLLVSSSFWVEPYFWGMLAVCRRAKTQNEVRNYVIKWG